MEGSTREGGRAYGRRPSSSDFTESGGDESGAAEESKEAKHCETRGERALSAGRDRARVANLAGRGRGRAGRDRTQTRSREREVVCEAL